MNEHKKGVKAVKYTTKPRNLVAKFSSATTSGSGAHKDKKHAMKRGEFKHKGKQFDYAEHLEKSLENQLEEMFHGGFGGQAKFTKAPKPKKVGKFDSIKNEIAKLKNLVLSGDPAEKDYAREEIRRLRSILRGEEVEEGIGKYLVTGAALIAALYGMEKHDAERLYKNSPQLQKLEQFHTQAIQSGDMDKAKELEQRILNQQTRLSLGKGEVKDKYDKPIDVVYDENTEESTEHNINEGTDSEGAMARSQLLVAAKLAIRMARKMRSDTQLDAWVQSKIAVASDYLETVFDFLEHGQQDVDQVSERKMK